MKKIITVFIVLVLALLVYSFAPTGYSFLEGEKTIIEISPKQTYKGGDILIELNPTKDGVSKLMTVHSENNLRKDLTDAWGTDCANYKRSSTGSICKVPWTIKYNTKYLEPGRYYFRFYDYKEKDFVKSELFTITE